MDTRFLFWKICFVPRFVPRFRFARGFCTAFALPFSPAQQPHTQPGGVPLGLARWAQGAAACKGGAVPPRHPVFKPQPVNNQALLRMSASRLLTFFSGDSGDKSQNST